LKKFHADETMSLYSKIRLYVDEVSRMNALLKKNKNQDPCGDDIFLSGKPPKDLRQLPVTVLTPESSITHGGPGDTGTLTLCQSSEQE
jgi:pSer/pThr/pTyr-binding forkhead associated (FHA) protein